MFEFTSRADVTVILHDETGRRIGNVKFNGGRYVTDSEAEAEALRRVSEFGITCVSAPVPEAAPAEPPPAPAVEDLPEPAPRRARPTKGHKHNG